MNKELTVEKIDVRPEDGYALIEMIVSQLYLQDETRTLTNMVEITIPIEDLSLTLAEMADVAKVRATAFLQELAG